MGWVFSEAGGGAFLPAGGLAALMLPLARQGGLEGASNPDTEKTGLKSWCSYEQISAFLTWVCSSLLSGMQCKVCVCVCVCVCACV